MAAHPVQDDDPGQSLALAMVLSSTAPLVLLDADSRVIAASASFCRAFDVDPAQTAGTELFELGHGEWRAPQLRSLMDATLSGDAEVEAYEMDLIRPGQAALTLVINVQKLAYGNPDQVRLLMSVADVTETRKDARRVKQVLLENEVLIQEVRHRIANSLQIIASVLMQNARRSKSPETRGHLRDAHQRVMSVADLQQQLAASTLGTVRLRVYLTKLCQTISASMISDPEQVAIVVDVDDAVIDAGISVSLGLIVTELVINSLKYGFPGEADGKIIVAYRTHDPGWSLSVSDNGVGLPAEKPAMAGLGTTIIEALARQLGAVVTVNDVGPGASISIVHPGAKAAKVAAPNLPEQAV